MDGFPSFLGLRAAGDVSVLADGEYPIGCRALESGASHRTSLGPHLKSGGHCTHAACGATIMTEARRPPARSSPPGRRRGGNGSGGSSLGPQGFTRADDPRMGPTGLVRLTRAGIELTRGGVTSGRRFTFQGTIFEDLGVLGESAVKHRYGTPASGKGRSSTHHSRGYLLEKALLHRH